RCSATAAIFAGTGASGGAMTLNRSAMIAAGSTMPASGTARMLAASDNVVARWKYQAMGNASESCITSEMTSSSKVRSDRRADPVERSTVAVKQARSHVASEHQRSSPDRHSVIGDPGESCGGGERRDA